MPDEAVEKRKMSHLSKCISNLNEIDSASYVLDHYKLLKYNPQLRIEIVKKCVDTIKTNPEQLSLLLKFLEKDNSLIGTFLYIYPTPEMLLENVGLRELARSVNISAVSKVKAIVRVFEQEKRYNGISDLVYYI